MSDDNPIKYTGPKLSKTFKEPEKTKIPKREKLPPSRMELEELEKARATPEPTGMDLVPANKLSQYLKERQQQKIETRISKIKSSLGKKNGQALDAFQHYRQTYGNNARLQKMRDNGRSITRRTNNKDRER